MALNTIISFSQNSPIETTTPQLVHGFLATILSEQDPNLVIESNKHQFMPAAHPAITTSKKASIIITGENIIGSPDHIDFYVTGTVENQQGETCNCILYLNLRSTSSEVDIFHNGFVKHPEDSPLVMYFTDGSEQFTDSIFELDLHKIDTKGKKHLIGHGKGYLLFQNNEDIKLTLKNVA